MADNFNSVYQKLNSVDFGDIIRNMPANEAFVLRLDISNYEIMETWWDACELISLSFVELVTDIFRKSGLFSTVTHVKIEKQMQTNATSFIFLAGIRCIEDFKDDIAFHIQSKIECDLNYLNDHIHLHYYNKSSSGPNIKSQFNYGIHNYVNIIASKRAIIINEVPENLINFHTIQILPLLSNFYRIKNGISLANIHTQVNCKELYIDTSPVTSNVLGLMLMKNTEIFGLSSRNRWANIIQTCRLLKTDVISCQRQLIKAGLKEYAKL